MVRVRLIMLVAAVGLGALSLPAADAATPAPTVTKVSPDYGPARGGTSVTVTGQNFDNVTAVRFGGKAARFRRVSSTELRATTPPHPKGRVGVTVVTDSGSGVEKVGYRYATRAAPPIGAGYRVRRTDAPSGQLRLRVPRLTCRPHETANLGAVAKDVQRLHANDAWAASVAFKCADGVASYHSYVTCGGHFATRLKTHPGDTVVLSYTKNSAGLDVEGKNSGGGAACIRPEPLPANEPEVAFLVSTPSTPPASLQSLTVHVTAGGKRLSAVHPTRQSQSLTTTTALRPSAILADGKTFTVRLQHR